MLRNLPKFIQEFRPGSDSSAPALRDIFYPLLSFWPGCSVDSPSSLPPQQPTLSGASQSLIQEDQDLPLVSVGQQADKTHTLRFWHFLLLPDLAKTQDGRSVSLAATKRVQISNQTWFLGEATSPLEIWYDNFPSLLLPKDHSKAVSPV